MTDVEPLERPVEEPTEPDRPDGPGQPPLDPPRRRGRVWIAAPVIAVGLVAAVVAVAARTSDTAFLYTQANPTRVEAPSVERLVMKAHEPLPGKHTPAATAATCRSGSTNTDLGNPWTCRVTYASHDRLTYRVTVARDGSIHGVDRTGTGFLNGCCLPVPNAR